MSDFCLGQKVSFARSLVKQKDYAVEYDNLTDEEREGITLERYKAKAHGDKQGFVSGKRTMVTAFDLTEVNDEFDGWRLTQTHQQWETVYLVACDMRRLYRVREEDLVEVLVNGD
ncbi:hypothetical protein [Aureibacillus halotolerans]|uniref:Uncharacterized protein n=1 Tax=Aureibacillus halotolerans TaxID=1508390 RepID=A0A4R6TUZ7_9BACI|nr:hypothetical protein [Aureibacillus halotolerans]TDQ35250.1 hypothetical protein EV213_12237 [Aureibacillus halotolerans]